MFQVLAYLQYGIAALFIIITPLIVISNRKTERGFIAALYELYFAQLFMYPPGADVSPYAYANSLLTAIRVAGLTLSALVSIGLIFYSVCALILRKKKFERTSFFLVLMVIFVNILSLSRSDSVTGSLDFFLKMVAPFIIWLYVQTTITSQNCFRFRRCVTNINLLLVIQVLVCKLLYGHFAAYNYYYELAEEYFGYYNHPHSYTGLLAVLSLWCIYEFNRKERPKLHLTLFGVNFLLMYLSNVRTYILALACGLLAVAFYTVQRKNMKRLRKYVYAAGVFLILFGSRFISSVGSQRVVGDVSSGRLERWALDLGYAASNFNVLEWIFGGGMEFIYSVNEALFGTSINSLNMYIDLLVDYGIVGLIVLTIAYFCIFRTSWTKNNAGFQSGVLVIFLVTSLINSIVTYVTIMTMIVLILFIMKIDASNSLEEIKYVGNIESQAYNVSK